MMTQWSSLYYKLQKRCATMHKWQLDDKSRLFNGRKKVGEPSRVEAAFVNWPKKFKDLYLRCRNRISRMMLEFTHYVNVKDGGDAILVMLPNFFRWQSSRTLTQLFFKAKRPLHSRKFWQEICITIAQSLCNRVYESVTDRQDTRHDITAGCVSCKTRIDLKTGCLCPRSSSSNIQVPMRLYNRPCGIFTLSIQSLVTP